MSSLPLITHPDPDSIVAWCAEGPVTRRRFLSDVTALAAHLPAGGHLLNLCGDRYRFSVGLAAAIVTGRISLLPSTHTPEVVRQIKAFAPDVFCLTDSDDCAVELPRLNYPRLDGAGPADPAVPLIDREQPVAVVFTSGSTGVPQPHPKTWGSVVRSVQAEAKCLGLLGEAHYTLVGTVPPQHMYGLESTLLLAWQSGNALCHAQPFYPADICQVLAAVPEPRVLVSSPVHLRALHELPLEVPALSLMVSATAPLAAQLALDIEARYACSLMEIYGCTETGQIASRCPTRSEVWQLLPGVRLLDDGGRTCASGGHVAVPTPLNDRIEALSETEFLLHGRLSDLVNIAGKRHSLAHLNHLLTAIPGVQDGAFFMPDDDGDNHVTRLAACVVASGLDAAALLRTLREHLDPVFLPRPLLFVDALPRNHTGKLPRDALRALLAARKATVSA